MSGGSVLALRPPGNGTQRGPQAGSERNPMNTIDARFITRSAVAPFSSHLRFALIIREPQRPLLHLLSLCGGFVEPFLATQHSTPFEVSINWRGMSRKTSFKRLFLVIMIRQDLEVRVDQLATKIDLAHEYYLKTRDSKKVIEKFYELVRELEKLKKELLH